MAKTYIGIDFGTTKTSVAQYTVGSKAPTSISLQDGKHEIPTLIAMNIASGQSDGWGDELVDGPPDGSKLYELFKLFAGREGNANLHTCAGGESKDIVEEFFRQIFITLQRNVFNGKNLDSADYQFIVGCPTTWEEKQRENFKKTIELAGFHNVELLNESIAIAKFHEYNRDVDFGNEPFLVVDFGGATINTGVFVPHEDGFTSIASLGKEIGGRDFDSAIADLQTQKIAGVREQSKANPRGALEYCKRLKVKFSNKMARGEESAAEQSWSGLKLSLNREEFETQCENLICEISSTILELFEKSNIELDKITKIVLSGGTGQFYFVRSELKKKFPHLDDSQIVYSTDVNQVVAKGLAVSKCVGKKIDPPLPPPPPPLPPSSWLIAIVVILVLIVSTVLWKWCTVNPPPPPENSPQGPVPRIVNRDCKGECSWGMCMTHYVGGSVEVRNDGKSGNIEVSATIQAKKGEEWITIGSHSAKEFFNAGERKSIDFSGPRKIRVSDCPKRFEIQCVPAVSVP